MFNTKCIKLTDNDYPAQLKLISNPPKDLYFKGTWDSGLFANCVGVVGSRRMSEYGRKACEQLVFELCSAGVTVVSGFMFGVDITAHRSAILSGGRTIAVMPCSVDTVVPAYEKSLYTQIQETGLVISEYPDTTLPKHWTFVKRNRIIAGLCHAVLVIEAAIDSGSLITADFAFKYKRKVFAVPGNITSKTSEGTLMLINSGKAKMVTSAKTILHSLKIENSLDLLSQRLIKCLAKNSHTIEDICILLNLPINDVLSELGKLELAGQVHKIAGKYALC